MTWVEDYLDAARQVAKEADGLARRLRHRGDTVVNVHAYAWDAFEAFVRRHYGDARPRVLALSMNPGRNGAVQTGIAFTDMATARLSLPEVDRLTRRPAKLRSDRVEVSGQKLVEWATARYGGVQGLYQRVVFAICCPVAVLRGPHLNNVPLPALTGGAKKAAERFYEWAAPLLVRAVRPKGLWVLGDFAAQRWAKVVDQQPDLDAVPRVVGPHPAAHISNVSKYDAWTRCMDALERYG